MKKLRIIVGGFIGLYPTGGATWDYIQYPLGLKLLGHDVYYIEDTRLYPLYQEADKAWDDASACVEYLQTVMNNMGLNERWAYRDIASARTFGIPEAKVCELIRTADVFINVSCSTFIREEYLKIPYRVLIDSDPMFTQIQYLDELEKNADTNTRLLLQSHNYLFTFGENIGSTDCRIPTLNYTWIPTRQPICLSHWKADNHLTTFGFTSVMNWSGRKKLSYQNEDWGQKDVEFGKFIDLPGKFPLINFEVVINPPLNKESDFNQSNLIDNRWKILDPKKVVPNYNYYSDFIRKSFGEFSVAKETYVKSRSGWFSCRSACYLAAGKPVLAQETSWSKFIPQGEGLISFTNIDEAQDGISEILSNPQKHRKAASEIAHEYFNSDIVLTNLLNQLNT